MTVLHRSLQIPRRTLAGLALLGGFLLPAAHAQLDLREEHTLLASDSRPDMFFGSSVALDGDVAVVGCQREDSQFIHGGAAYVYRFDGQQWIEEQKLIPAAVGNMTQFGHTVAIHGDRILVGGINAPIASYDRVNGTWIEGDSLDNPFAGNSFGSALSLDGDLAIVGALGDQTAAPGAGMGYVFRQALNGDWNLLQSIQPRNPRAGGSFGCAIVFDGATLVIGASGIGIGDVDVLTYNVGTDQFDWLDTLTPSDGVAGDRFGTALHMDTTTIHVGAPFHGNGAVYQYTRSGGGWTENKLSAPSLVPTKFGESLGGNDELLAVGTPAEAVNGSRTGAIYLYRGNRVQTLIESAPVPNGALGQNIAVSGDRILASRTTGNPGDTGHVAVASAPSLTLAIQPPTPSSEDTLSFANEGGATGALSLLYLVELSGEFQLMQLLRGKFAADGTWSFSATVPIGLTGLTTRFVSIGFTDDGVSASNTAWVDFQ